MVGVRVSEVDMLSSHAAGSYESGEGGLGFELIALLLSEAALPDGRAQNGNGKGAEKNQHGDLELLIEAICRDACRSGVIGEGGVSLRKLTARPHNE